MTLDERLARFKADFEFLLDKGIKLSDALGYRNTGYAYDLDIMQYQEVENDFARILLADRIEIKAQPKVSESGNVYIEWECDGRPSGIQTTEAQWIVLPFDGQQYQREVYVVIATSRLTALLDGCHYTTGGDNGRTLGYLVPRNKLLWPNKRFGVSAQLALFATSP